MSSRSRINITIHKEDLVRLDEMAKSRGFSRSELIGRLITEAWFNSK